MQAEFNEDRFCWAMPTMPMIFQGRKGKSMKLFKKTMLALVLFIAVFASACTTKPTTKTTTKKIKIVVAIYPAYDWIKQIMGDNFKNADVTFLLDKGVDIHNYQASVEDIAKIKEADIFVHVGGESDKWVANALKNPNNKNRKVINMVETIGKKTLKEENKIDYDVLIKNFLAGQGIDYRYVETNINFLKEKYTDEIIYKEIVRINGIKDVRANIDPKKYLIASINNLDEIKEEKKVDRKQSGRLQTINENNVENKEEIINSLFNFADEEE